MATSRRLAVIITALPLERLAVQQHLREVGQEPEHRGSIYRRGVFDERSEPWDVIIAEIGAGNANAAAEVVRIIDHYSPRVALFVGIAGGLKDVKHGDVVASTKVYGYESGKDETEFKTRPMVQLPDYRLEQRARYEAGEADWRQRIKGESSPEGATPTATVGPIAAGEKVAASNLSQTYKLLRQHYNDAVAVEMEGHGFLLGVRMNPGTQGIVVRGISDLVDDKDETNDKEWQPIAARHATAFAFQILANFSDTAGESSTSLAVRFDDDWQKRHLRDVVATAGPRYTRELHVGTPLHEIFEALCGTDEWLTSVRSRARKLAKTINRFLECVGTKEDGVWKTAFPEQLREPGIALIDPIKSVNAAFDSILATPKKGTTASFARAVAEVLPRVREVHVALRSEFEKRHGEGMADSASFRQFQAEYQMSFPAANLDAARDLVGILEEFETWAKSAQGRAADSKSMLLVGGPGIGKTYGICDMAYDRFRRGLRTVVLFGEHFTSGNEPWERIRQLIGMGPMGRDDVLARFDAAGKESGNYLLFCIDGLNESRPRGYWRNWLASLATQVASYPNIKLCVSCRTTYEPIAIPEGHGLERVEYLGFAGVEFTACQEFFAYYGLEPPAAPVLHPEFSNPLFLRLACETLKSSGERRMPSGWHGLSTALQAFLREKNKAFAREYDRDERERIPQKAMQEFMAEAERSRRVYVPWSDAALAIARVQPSGMVGPSVLDWLVRSGLLITDANPEIARPDAEEIVRVAFERLGDHLFAARLLANVKPGDLATAIEFGSLSFAFASSDAVLEQKGLVEALTIQVPEHPDFSNELIDVLSPGNLRDAVLQATISALPWRDPDHMSNRTQEIVLEALNKRGDQYQVFDNLLAVATQKTGPDALWLHGLLSRKKMRFRDEYLCPRLHDRVGVSGVVERLLSAPFEVKAADISESVCIRWATLLLWFCVAADRRVRDRATKGLVAITQARSMVWASLILQFRSVDDEYVLERCFCAAYGALLRSRDRNAEREVAAATYEVVFRNPATIQNALIRDHARCIIELAAHDGVLPAGIEMSAIRPPYSSDWPLTIPTEEDVKQYADSSREYPKLHTSCLSDDFFTYTLSALEPYEYAIPRTGMARWILDHIVQKLGYGGRVLASYDGYMLYTYGSGRGRPGWADRIGKKYQWIALSRLIARLADNLKAKSERSWEPKVRGIPLVYAGGRDIDPSLLARGSQRRREGAAWWIPVEYDFSAVETHSNTDWIASSHDVPSTERVLQPLGRGDGSEWQLLDGHPTWSAITREEHDEGFKPFRQVWTLIQGYLVKSKSADRVFKWMAKQHFMGRWMPEGAGFHEGYAGEYPWSILFTMYPDRWHGRPGRGKKAPATLIPVCNSISSSYEEDTFQDGAIAVQVPARTFFEHDELRWDGLSGYRDAAGQLRFLDPSIVSPGPPALLVDRRYLLSFLRHNDLAVVWAVLGEKIYISGNGGSPRLEYSRAHMLDSHGNLSSSALTVRND